MVGLDVTRQLVLAPSEATRLAHSGAAQAMWIQDALRFYMEFHKRQEGLDGCIVNDVLPIAELVHPGLLSFEEERLMVDLDEADHRGHTRVDPDGARVKVAMRVELGPVRRLLSERVFRWAARAATAPIALPSVHVSGRCRRQDRCLVAHPLNPPELIPLVELVPGPRTTQAAVARAQDYLRSLGRMPILLKKAVPGYVVGRIAAAVWRQCIDLVLEGVIDVDELDRAVSLGPALGWAAAGPHLTYHLAAGDGGVTLFMQQLLASFESRWAELSTWQRLEPEQQRALINAVQRAYQNKLGTLREARDRRLGAILRALEQARTTTT